MKNILFDLDGTLLNSLPDIHHAINKTLNHFNLGTVDKDYTAKSVGFGTKYFLEQILIKINKENMFDEVNQFYMKFYEENCVVYGNLYDGVLDGISKLKQKNYNMFVITNKPHKIAIETINRLGIANYFTEVIGDGLYQDIKKPSCEIWENIEKKYKLDKNETIIVGDGIADYEFSKNTGIEVLLVLYGITLKETLLELNASKYYNSFDEVVEHIIKMKDLSVL